MSEPIRLAKRVADLKGCSRSEAERYIEGGWVRVDGQVVETPAYKVALQRVEIDPHATLIDDGPVTLLLYKPVGYEAALGPANAVAGAKTGPGPGQGPSRGAGQPLSRPHAAHGSRSRGAPAAEQLLVPAAQMPGDPSGIRRLQKHFAHLQALAPMPTEASGLAVFTQDWRVARKLTQDADLVEQEVMAEVAGEVTPEQLRRLCHGLRFNDRALPAIKVSISSNTPTQTRLRFALKGIRPGQVPFMCDAVGLQLLTLKRLRVGRVALGGLAEGQWRYLQPHERF